LSAPAIAIVGGGPAGSSAALAALAAGRPVRLFEKSRFPRPKVCGEFLSPQAAVELGRLGVREAFEAARPALIRRAVLHLGSRQKSWSLEEPAYGLSRSALDHLLLEQAAARGAEVRRETASDAARPCVLAHGRRAAAPRGRRLFGFKAHFTGPADDAVSLYFFNGCYVGVCAVEDGRTNVCGLAPEHLLRPWLAQLDHWISNHPPLAARVAPLTRGMEWLITGPLVYEARFRALAREQVFPAGDALGFIDPFTGTGILSALVTGRLAGEAAARGVPPPAYLRDCARALEGPYRAASLFRAALRCGAAEALAAMVPGSALFRWTRPRL
jgi:flavin-dependent dehydrogenase